MGAEPVAAGTTPAFASFPVVFFDGDSEIDVGSVAVHPSLEFKEFQAAITQMIGVASHQISISLVRRRKARASPDVRRKVPIDEASDFAAIARERDCFVLSVLRRSRRERRARSRRKSHDAVAGEGKKAAPEMKILRRNPAAGSGRFDPTLGVLGPEAAAAGPGLWDLEEQLRSLQRQRERYLAPSPVAASYYPFAAAEVWYAWEMPRGLAEKAAAAAAAMRPAACEECQAAKAEGRPPGFHWCVHDAVTVGFRSPVGPIQRPPKNHVEASA